MLDALTSLHWPAIAVATIAYYLLGVPWFEPWGFGKSWAQGIGFDRPARWKPGAMLYIIPLLACFAASLATAVIARATASTTILDALVLALTLAFGYSVAIAGVDAVSPDNPRPAKAFAVTGSYHLVGLVIVSCIVTLWR